MKTLCARRKKGFTIIELVVCIGITAFFFAAILALLMSIVMQNRMTQLQVAGLMAARSAAEEIETIANSSSRRSSMLGSADTTFSNAIQYLSYVTSNEYSNKLGAGSSVTNTGNTIEIEYFINTVGYAPRDKEGRRLVADGSTTPSGNVSDTAARDGLGRMKITIYLNESTVPVAPNGDTSSGDTNFWEDMNGGGGRDGFDMNADGVISSGPLVDSNLHWNISNVNSNYRTISQLPIDIQVTVNHPTYRKLSYVTDYRLVLSSLAHN